MTNNDIATLVHQVLTTRDHQWVTKDGRRVPTQAEVKNVIEGLIKSNLEDTYDDHDGMTLASTGGIIAERYWIDQDTWYDDVYVYVGRYQL